ncbi:hypothetical protein B0H11DRAFT_1939728 [Mycena galericulata]|nr:hypothetical protein B0H11DRAFT_1939728 [Mycena galericulata]
MAGQMEEGRRARAGRGRRGMVVVGSKQDFKLRLIPRSSWSVRAWWVTPPSQLVPNCKNSLNLCRFKQMFAGVEQICADPGIRTFHWHSAMSDALPNEAAGRGMNYQHSLLSRSPRVAFETLRNMQTAGVLFLRISSSSAQCEICYIVRSAKDGTYPLHQFRFGFIITMIHISSARRPHPIHPSVPKYGRACHRSNSSSYHVDFSEKLNWHAARARYVWPATISDHFSRTHLGQIQSNANLP